MAGYFEGVDKASYAAAWARLTDRMADSNDRSSSQDRVMTHRVALVGERMLELQGKAFGAIQQAFGGDTLNAPVYLACCGGAAASVRYAIGVDDVGGLLADSCARA